MKKNCKTKKYQSGGITQQLLGYKDNSPYKNLPTQTFNTDTLTMDGVSQPILAIADNGEMKIMQPNSGKHKFKGAKSVVEVPIMQNGGQPTMQDSLMLYNNARAVEQYYNNKKYRNLYNYNSNYINFNELKDELDSDYSYFIESDEVKVPLTNGKSGYVKPNKVVYRKIIDDNKFLQREKQASVLDIRSPMQMYDTRIAPTKVSTYLNEGEKDMLIGDLVQINKYDPAIIAPESKKHLLSKEELKRRQEYQSKNIVSKDGKKYKTKGAKLVDGDQMKESGNNLAVLNSRLVQKQRPKIGIDGISTIIPQIKYNDKLPALTLDVVKNLANKDGALTKDMEGVPNIKVVYEKTEDGQLIPVAYKNQLGRTIPYGDKLTKKFQYPGQFQNGGIADILAGLTSGIESSGDFNMKFPKLDASFEDFVKTKGWQEFKRGGHRGWMDTENQRLYSEDEAKSQWHSSNLGSIQSSLDYNNQLPIAKNLASLFDLQTMEQDSAANTKLNIGDMPIENTNWYAKNGGRLGKIANSILNPNYKNGGKVKPYGVYENGGYLMSGSKRIMTVGNETKPTGLVFLQNILPIQAEKKELFVLPTGDVVDTNATKRHSQMEEDLVTDLAPQDTYILPSYGDIKISKEDADEIVLEVEDKPYNIFGKNKKPELKTLGDLMHKKTMSPAEIGRKILKKFKIEKQDDDIFTKTTNEQNKYNRGKYLNSLVTLTELEREDKGLTNDEPVLPTFMNGGFVKKYQLGGILSGILGLYTDSQNRDLITRNTVSSINDINSAYKEQTGLSNAGLLANLTGFAAQNPNIDPTINSSTYLDQIPTRVPQQYADYNISKLYANRPNFSGMNPQTAALLSDQFYSNAQNAQSQYALGAGQDRVNRLTSYLNAKQQLTNSNEKNRVDAKNLTRANSNNLIAGAAGAVSGNMTDKINLLTNKTQSLLGARGQQTAGMIQLNSQLAQTLANSAALGMQGYNNYMNSRNPNPQVQNNMPNISNVPVTSSYNMAPAFYQNQIGGSLTNIPGYPF